MKHLKLPALLLALVLLLTLAACKPAAAGPSQSPSEEPSQSAPPSAEPTQEPSPEPTETPSSVEHGEIRLAVLSGPTSIGAAKLLDRVDNSPADLSYGNYKYDIYTDNSELVAGLTKGEIDIATVASNLYLYLFII